MDLIETQESNLQDRYDYLVNISPPTAETEWGIHNGPIKLQILLGSGILHLYRIFNKTFVAGFPILLHLFILLSWKLFALAQYASTFAQFKVFNFAYYLQLLELFCSPVNAMIEILLLLDPAINGQNRIIFLHMILNEIELNMQLFFEFVAS